MRRRKARGTDLKLADLVPEVRADYAAFLRMTRGEEEDPKAFGARHAAAKAALAHLEHLIKIAGCSEDAADGAEPGEGLLSDMRRMMNQEEQETPDDDAAGEPG